MLKGLRRHWNYRRSNHYIDQNIPVIVSDGAIDWPVISDPDFNLDTISKVRCV